MNRRKQDLLTNFLVSALLANDNHSKKKTWSTDFILDENETEKLLTIHTDPYYSRKHLLFSTTNTKYLINIFNKL